MKKYIININELSVFYDDATVPYLMVTTKNGIQTIFLSGEELQQILKLVTAINETKTNE